MEWKSSTQTSSFAEFTLVDRALDREDRKRSVWLRVSDIHAITETDDGSIIQLALKGQPQYAVTQSPEEVLKRMGFK